MKRGGFQRLRDHGKAGREGPGESRVKGVFGLRCSLGVCRESESLFRGHEGWRGAQRRNTHTAQGGVSLCLALNFHCEGFSTLNIFYSIIFIHNKLTCFIESLYGYFIVRKSPQRKWSLFLIS